MFTIQIYVIAFIGFGIGCGCGLVCYALMHPRAHADGDNA